MDIQHEMALIIAKQITKMEFEMKEDKFNILVYGIEVFLNEAIKVVVIVCLGILIDFSFNIKEIRWGESFF